MFAVSLVVCAEGAAREGGRGEREGGLSFLLIQRSLGWLVRECVDCAAETSVLRQEGTRQPPPCQRSRPPTSALLSKGSTEQLQQKKKRIIYYPPT